MKNKIFTLAAISSLFVLGACSDDSGSETMAEQCEKGISEDCLVGSWNLESISTLDGSETLVKFGNPGKLIINDDGTFAYTLSTDATDECAGQTVKGKWEIVDDQSFKYIVKNGDCIEPSGSFTPDITVEGETPKMSTKKVLFQQSSKNSLNAGNESEVFVRTL